MNVKNVTNNRFLNSLFYLILTSLLSATLLSGCGGESDGSSKANASSDSSSVSPTDDYSNSSVSPTDDSGNGDRNKTNASSDSSSVTTTDDSDKAKTVRGVASINQEPIASAKVHLFDLSTGNHIASTQTDNQGKYSFDNIITPATSYKVVVNQGIYEGKSFSGELINYCDNQDNNSCNPDLYTTTASKKNNNIEQFRAAKRDVVTILGADDANSINKQVLNKQLGNQTENFSSFVSALAQDVQDGFIDNSAIKATFIQARIRPDDPRPVDPNPGMVESVADQLLEETLATLNDPNIPSTTKAEFEKTAWANKTAEDIAAEKRLKRAQSLALHAEDPDPAWKTTGADNDMVIGKPGGTYTIEFYKRDYEGKRIGDITQKELDMLRLEVRLQVAVDDYRYIPTEYHHNYVKWIEVAGKKKLQVMLPNTLSKGRLIVGVRPNFEDEGQRALTERWSKAVTVEVWPTKPGVHTLEGASDAVIFPLGKDSSFATDAAFSLEDIKTATKAYMDDSQEPLVLPLVVKGASYKVGDLIDYMVGQRPHSGEVGQVIIKNNQQLLLLVPKVIKIYNIMGGEEGFLKKQGVAPENIIFREGGQLPEFGDSESETPKHIGPKDKIAIQGLKLPGGDGELFEKDCSGGISANLFSFTFTPELDFFSGKLGLKMTYGFGQLSTSGTCKIEANPDKFKIDLADSHPITRVLNRIVGLGAELSVYGGISANIKVTEDMSAGFKMTLGYSYQAGKGGTPTNDFDFTGGGSGKGLKGVPGIYEVGAGGDTGVEAKLTVFKLDKESDNLAGFILWLFGSDITLDISANAKAGPQISAALKSLNAAKVYKSGGSSGLSADFNAVFEVGISEGIKKIAKYFSVNILKLSIKYETPKVNLVKADAKYILADLNDDGQGSASAKITIPSDSLFLRQLFGLIGTGYASIKDESSSVFNDKNSAISYKLDECKQRGGKIETPFVGCVSTGILCAPVEKAKLCGGQVQITPVSASAIVGDMASTSGTVKVTGSPKPNENPLQISVSGGPLSPSPTSFSLKSGESESFIAEDVCSSIGVHRGTITASAGGDNTNTQTNIQTCKCKPNTKDCDRNWGDPYFVTADGMAYDYIASGDYVMQRIVDENNVPIEGLEVQARFLPGHEVSWTHAAAIRVGNDIVEFEPSILGRGLSSIGMEVKINGNYAYRPAQNGTGGTYAALLEDRLIHLPDGGMIFIDKFVSQFFTHKPAKVTVIWPDDSPFADYGVQLGVPEGRFRDPEPFMNIQFIRPEKFKGQERGLMGNNDGDPNNEFVRRNGQVLGGEATKLSWSELYGLFGGDWLVKGGECLFSDGCMQQPDFPTTAKILTPEQRTYGEAACRNLVGFYKEACVHDAGLTGNADLIKSFYANTEDLNEMAAQITTPGVDYAFYSLNAKPAAWDDTVTSFNKTATVSHLKGQGKFLLTIRPPRGATAKLIDPSTGKAVNNLVNGLAANNSQDYQVKVDCATADPDWQNLASSVYGSLQLWSVDPLSGFAADKIDEVMLSCRKPTNESFVQAKSGKNLALDYTNRLWQWGAGYSTRPQPTQIQTVDLANLGETKVWRLAHGHNHNLLIDEFSKLWAWGINGHGKLGMGDNANYSKPTELADVSEHNFIQVATGQSHSLALDEYGHVWAWGYNGYGQLGTDDTSGANIPLQLPISHFGSEIVVAIAAGSHHSLAVTQSGKLYSWGYNAYGQLGIDNIANQSKPVLVDTSVPTPAGTVKSIDIAKIYASAHQSFVLDSAGKLWAWGQNNYGQLGINNTTNQSKLTAITGFDSKVVQFAIGQSHALAITDTGKLYAWGHNNYGQLGTGDTNAHSAPVVVNSADSLDLIGVSAGSNHTVAISRKGKLYAWGNNDRGQLGTGDKIDQLTPVEVKLKSHLIYERHAASKIRLRVGEKLNDIAQYQGIYPVFNDAVINKPALKLVVDSVLITQDTHRKQAVTNMNLSIECTDLGEKTINYHIADLSDNDLTGQKSVSLQCLPPVGVQEATITTDQQTMLGGEVQPLGNLKLNIQPKLGDSTTQLTLKGEGVGFNYRMDKTADFTLGNKQASIYVQCDTAGVTSRDYQLIDDTGKVIYSGVAKVNCLPAASVTANNLKAAVTSTEGQHASIGSLTLQVNAAYRTNSVTIIAEGEDIGFKVDDNEPLASRLSASKGEKVLEVYAACSSVGTTERTFKITDGAGYLLHEGRISVDCQPAAKVVNTTNLKSEVIAIDGTGMESSPNNNFIHESFVSVGYAEFEVYPAVGTNQTELFIDGKDLGFLWNKWNSEEGRNVPTLANSAKFDAGKQRVELHAQCKSVAKEERSYSIKDKSGNTLYTGKVTVDCLANVTPSWNVTGDGVVKLELNNHSKQSSGQLRFVAYKAAANALPESSITLGSNGDVWTGKIADENKLSLDIQGVSCPVPYQRSAPIGEFQWLEGDTVVKSYFVSLSRAGCETQGYFFDPVNLTVLQGAKFTSFKSVGSKEACGYNEGYVGPFNPQDPYGTGIQGPSDPINPDELYYRGNSTTLNLGLDNKGRLWRWDVNNPLSGNPTSEPVSLDLSSLAGASVKAYDASLESGILVLDNNGKVWSRSHGNTSFIKASLPSNVTYTAVSAGSGHGLALDSTGKLWAWGDNYLGQLGNGSSVSVSQDKAVNVDLEPLAGAKVVAISAGNGLSMLQDSLGRVWYWGAPLDSVVGYVQPEEMKPTLRPTLVSLDSMYDRDVKFSAKARPYVLDSHGRVWYWRQSSKFVDRTVGGEWIAKRELLHAANATPTGRNVVLASLGTAFNSENVLALGDDNKLWLANRPFKINHIYNNEPDLSQPLQRKKVHLNMLNGAGINYVHTDSNVGLIFDTRGNLWQRNLNNYCVPPTSPGV